jgi:NADPH:quinone reductase-like Zn-dependent oxidoreductase
VLVIGAGGGVGCFAVQLAKAFGASVTGVCSSSKLELVRSLGADEVLDYTKGDFTDGPPSCDLILETAGRRPISRLRQRLTETGTLVIVGGEGGGAWLGGFERNLLAPLRAVGSKQKLIGLMFEERQQDLLTLKDLAESGQLKPVIDRTYPLAEAPAAIRYLEAGHARGKVVVTVN